MRLARLLNITVGLDIDSTPPARPISARPATIESKTDVMADVPAIQLSTTVSARTEDGSPLENTTSLASCGILASSTVIP